MSEYSLRNFPVILDGTSEYYGGNQEWYPGMWQRRAGCASVAGADIAAYFMIDHASIDMHYTKEQFVHRMLDMYAYMTPGIDGFPHADRFAAEFEHYAADRGRTFRGEVFRDWKQAEEAQQYIARMLSKQIPVALLVLNHEWEEIRKRDDIWHWMVITGIDGNGNIAISNCGRKETYDSEPLLKPGRGNEVRLVTMQEA